MTIKPSAGSGTRPTKGLARAAVFNSVQNSLPDAQVLDLFAGTGAMGLEALSRGARSCTFVEYARPALAALQENIKEAQRRFKAQGLDAPRIFVIPKPLATAWEDIWARGPFELIWADPPYEDSTTTLPEILTKLFDKGTTSQGTLIFETGTAIPSATRFPGWSFNRVTKYGNTYVHWFERTPK